METFWGIIVSNTVVAAALALGAMALGRLWKNAAASHLLWIAVLLKLFAPPIVTAQPPFAWSVLSLASPDSSDPGAPAASEAETGRTTSPASTSFRNTIPADHEMQAAWNHATQRAARWVWPLSRVLVEIWIGGACCVAVFYAVRIRRFARLVRTFEQPSPAIRSLVAEISRRLGLRRAPEVRMTSRALPPLVWSMGIRPRIILPSALFARLSSDAQAAILAHELVHVHRRDYLVRLLELAATTVFWWHPIVRWATRQLRELEEQCCDARVLQLLPHLPRTYAAALVDTLEFLSEQPLTPVPLPTAIHSAGSLSRRIRGMTQNRTHRLSVLSAAILAAIVSVPLVVGFAGDPAKKAKASPQEQQTAGGPVAVVEGRVIDEAGAPLPDTLVRVAVPAADMRSVNSRSPGVVETKAGPAGDYRLEIRGITRPTKVSLDAMHLGYRRLVGTFMKGGDVTQLEIAPSATVEQSLTLRGPTLYFSGTVVDEKGQPISGVAIAANANTPFSSAGIESTQSGADGTFELFNYTPDRIQVNLGASKGVVSFFHPDYVGQNIDDVYAIAAKDRENLRVVLPSGHQLNGIVLDTAGKPVPQALVKAERGNHRKTTLTDAKGHFTLRGLSEGPITLSVRALDIKQKTKLTVTMDHDIADLSVRLKAISLPANLKTVTVLRMQLTDVTPQLHSAYDLFSWNTAGALILDPGKDSGRLAIGTLAEGYCFWVVGEHDVRNVRDFVERLVTAADRQPGPIHRIRVVYTFQSLKFDGTNTQYIKLTQDDVKELRSVLAQLPPADAANHKK